MDSQNSEIVRQDKNFMEYPIWFQNTKLAEKSDKGYYWEDMEGYVYRSAYKPPTKIDFLYLLYLFMICQEKGWSDKFSTTRAEILRGCGIAKSHREYKRLEDSLERWENVRIKFSGKFYDGKEYQTLNFGVIDSWGIEKQTKKLWVRFSPEWLLYQRKSKFYELINFKKIKRLKDPLSTRLYEIIVKQFHKRQEWQINAMKLARKIPMAEKYPSDVIPKIKTAVKRISKNTDIAVSVSEKKIKRGQTTLIFNCKKSKPFKQLNLFPQDEKIKQLKSEAWQCYSKNANMCRADPKDHQNGKTACFYCKKFK